MVSIIITYVDELDFLREAILSAKSQRQSSTEIIGVCNGIEKQTLEKDFPEVQWMHELRRGSFYARNSGLHKATGDWIQFLDVDDLLLPDKIANQLKYAGEKTGAIVSPHIFRTIKGKEISSKWIDEDAWTGLLNSGLGSTSSMLWNREAVLAVGGWSSKYQSHQEYDLLFRLLQQGFQIAFCKSADTIVRERQVGSITLLTRPVRAKEGIILRESMWEHIRKNSLQTPQRHNAFLQYMFRQLRGLYIVDRQGALALFNKYFASSGFHPEKPDIPFYSLVYRMLGFKRTEDLIAFYRSLRNKFSQRRVKQPA